MVDRFLAGRDSSLCQVTPLNCAYQSLGCIYTVPMVSLSENYALRIRSNLVSDRVNLLCLNVSVNALVTNFHQPRSTLLMLLSAFHGGHPDEVFRIYAKALDEGYRFLSYGDSSIYANSDFFQKTE